MMIIFMVLFALPLQAFFIIPDFDQAMHNPAMSNTIVSAHTRQEIGIEGSELMRFFKTLYDKNNPSKLIRSPSPKIPKIIHQIWIGKSLPEEFKKMTESWRLYHPEWEYKLWTQNDIAQLHLRNQKLIEQSRNPGEISDLMRYEILYQYGGVYLDVDFECLRALDEFHYLYDFYIGIQPLDSGLVQLGIGIIGSVPGHPILNECIERVQREWHNQEHERKATARTGPIYCTKVFYDVADRKGLCDVALPPSYFYPLACNETEIKKIEWVLAGAFAVHHWAKSWLYPSFRKPEFQGIKNY